MVFLKVQDTPVGIMRVWSKVKKVGGLVLVTREGLLWFKTLGLMVGEFLLLAVWAHWVMFVILLRIAVIVNEPD
ncbi:hypothetical protein EYC80_003865 [Monilinia laxa]|uniref:Transmembrane protein n=1 Tax=Monilinia laxa TaxID=61186 RepID=A0A5N6KLA0_MONLA|nr:hypothetical protein EYC80_003865 [Monilinia laxa]